MLQISSSQAGNVRDAVLQGLEWAVVRNRTVAAERMFPVSLFGLFLSIPCFGLSPGFCFLSRVTAISISSNLSWSVFTNLNNDKLYVQHIHKQNTDSILFQPCTGSRFASSAQAVAAHDSTPWNWRRHLCFPGRKTQAR
jgi:hypothetical protein